MRVSRIIHVIMVFVVVSAVQALAEDVKIYIPADAANPVKHGATVLKDRLQALPGGDVSGVEIVEQIDTGALEAGDIVIADVSNGGSSSKVSEMAGMEVPATPESYILTAADGVIFGIGSDAVGAMYSAYDIAEQAEIAGLEKGIATAVDSRTRVPFMEIRAVNPFFHVEAFNDPESWYYDEEFWASYLDELSADRYNLLDIHAMYGLISTFFPNCYLYLLKSDNYPEVGIDAEQAAKNLAMFNRIIEMAADRGIRVSLMSYHASWHLTRDDETSPEPNDEQLVEYTREMVRKIIEKCPDLWMVGFRIGESGRREDFFQHSYIAGIKDAGRDIMLFTRSWLAAPWQVLQIADAYPGRFFVEIKYNGEQLGLPYHAMTTNRRGTAPSYTFENYTDWPRNYKILWQIRTNGTHRLFRWGDPAFARRCMGTVQFASGAGFTMEPMTSYYPHTNYFFKPELGFDFFTWDHQRNWFWYMVWGRLAYNNDEPEEVWLNRFSKHYGDAGADAYETVKWMSRIVPLVYSWRCLGPDHRNMAPEYETGGDLGGFAENFPLDPRSIYSVDEYVNHYLYNDPLLDVKLDPFEAADLLEKYADKALSAAGAAGKNAPEGNTEFESLRVELEMLVHLALYYSNKIRAATYFEFYNQKRTLPELQWAKKYTADAHEEWDKLSENGEMYFQPILDTLRIRKQVGKSKFTWRELQPQLDDDARLLAEAEDNLEDAAGDEDLAIFHVPTYIAPAGIPLKVSATVIGGGDKEVKLIYRRKGSGDFSELEMTNDSDERVFMAEIPAAVAKGDIEYFIGAVSGGSKARYPGPGMEFPVKPASRDIEAYIDGSARDQQVEWEKRVEYEKTKYISVSFAEENDPPVISVESVDVKDQGNKVVITARVEDDSPIKKAVIHYKNIPSGELWVQRDMEPAGDGLFSAELDLTPSGLLYYFHVADEYHNASAYPDFLEQTPYLVIESWDPALNPYTE